MLLNEIINEVGMTKRAVKYYEEKGLLSVDKDSNGYRNYSAQDVETLKKISVYRKLGIGIKDIQSLLKTGDKSILLRIYQEKLQEKVLQDEDMFQLVESIKERGVITPATVRQKEDGRYELISGHRRKKACELAGFETLRCEVVDLDRDEATILMVESNFQRSQILPSEKAHAYKMRLDAMKRQGQRTDLTCAPLGDKLVGTKSVMLLADKSDDSKTQIQRYIRLTNLVPELLEFVDEGRIKMRPAVELSYLNEDCQRDLVDEIDLNDCTPSHDQAIRMRKFFEEGKLTTEAISAIMSEEKPNQREKIVLRGDRVRNLIPKNIPINQTEEYVCKALEHYNKFLRNRAERDSR